MPLLGIGTSKYLFKLYLDDFYIDFAKNLPNNFSFFANLTHSVSTIISWLCNFQKSKSPIFDDYFLYHEKSFKNPPNCTLSAKMKFPWLEYEKWYNASWYTIKPDFCKYCQILPEKMDSGSGKPDTWSRNYFVLKHIWVWMSKSWKFQTYWSNNTLNTEFFQISRKMGYQIRIYWA